MEPLFELLIHPGTPIGLLGIYLALLSAHRLDAHLLHINKKLEQLDYVEGKIDELRRRVPDDRK